MALPRTVDLPIDLDYVLPRLAKLVITDTGCWEWTGGKSKDGYGRMQVPADGSPPQREERVHRLVYRLFGGDIGPYPLHHKSDICGNKACANPAHVEPVTHQEHKEAHYKTECKYGHSLSGDNLVVGKGYRRCRTCANARSKRYGRAKSTYQAGPHKTHCLHGHPWVPENLYTHPGSGYRECIACIRARSARRRKSAR